FEHRLARRQSVEEQMIAVDIHVALTDRAELIYEILVAAVLLRRAQSSRKSLDIAHRPSRERPREENRQFNVIWRLLRPGRTEHSQVHRLAKPTQSTTVRRRHEARNVAGTRSQSPRTNQARDIALRQLLQLRGECSRGSLLVARVHGGDSLRMSPQRRLR